MKMTRAIEVQQVTLSPPGYGIRRLWDGRLQCLRNNPFGMEALDERTCTARELLFALYGTYESALQIAQEIAAREGYAIQLPQRVL